MKRAPVYRTDVPAFREQAVRNVILFFLLPQRKKSLKIPAVFVLFLNVGAFFLWDILSLCKSLEDLGYPSATMMVSECDAVQKKQEICYCPQRPLVKHTQSHIKWIYIFLELLYSRLGVLWSKGFFESLAKLHNRDMPRIEYPQTASIS